MRSRLPVAAAVLGGLLAGAAIGYFSALVAVMFTYDTLRPFVPIAFLIFTLATVPVGLLVAWKGTTPLQRGFASGLLASWVAIGVWVGVGGSG